MHKWVSIQCPRDLCVLLVLQKILSSSFRFCYNGSLFQDQHMNHLIFDQRSNITCVLCNMWFLQVIWPYVNWRNLKCSPPCSSVSQCCWSLLNSKPTIGLRVCCPEARPADHLSAFNWELCFWLISLKPHGALEGTCCQKFISHRFVSKAEFVFSLLLTMTSLWPSSCLHFHETTD